MEGVGCRGAHLEHDLMHSREGDGDRTYKTVKGTYKTVKGIFKTVKGTYKTVNARYKTVKGTYKTVKIRHIYDSQSQIPAFFARERSAPGA